MNKRETALERIRTEYAKYGQETAVSMTAYNENNISGGAWLAERRAGLKIYNNEKAGDE